LRATLGYNRALDGLRALAVAAVIADHAGYLIVGSYGVIVFFVVSGYLITGLLLTEHESTGRIGIRSFYRRRWARLAPALLVIVAVTLVWVLAIGVSVSKWIAGLIGALTYTTNFVEVTGAQTHISSYYEWSWSLAIEEQFYLVWPVLMIVVLYFGRRWGRALLASVAVGVIVLAWVIRAGMVNSPAQSQRLSFSFESHMDAIALGAVLAIVTVGFQCGRWLRVVTTVAATLAAFELFQAVDGYRPIVPLFAQDARAYAQVSVLCVVLVAALVSAPSGPLARLLAWGPLVHLGRLSYGLYLWNMLFMNGFNELFGHKPVHAGWAGLLWLAALIGVAEASYRYVETPLRRRWAHRPERTDVPAAQPRTWELATVR
jgi:peptidoglycan/LPS O-acetylase OafA/YrhL